MERETKWAVILAVTVVVLALVAAVGYAIFVPNKLERQISRAKEAVAAKLIDGESARFRNVRQVSSIGICGEVNGKNLYGAYTGFTGFFVWGTPGDKMVGVEIEGDGRHTMVKKECGS